MLQDTYSRSAKDSKTCLLLGRVDRTRYDWANNQRMYQKSERRVLPETWLQVRQNKQPAPPYELAL